MIDRVFQCDYLLVRTGLETADTACPVEAEVERLVLASPEQFTGIERFPLPQGNAEAVLYRFAK